MKHIVWMLALWGCSLAAHAQSQWVSTAQGPATDNQAHVERVVAIDDSSMNAKLFHTMAIDGASFNPWFLYLAVVNEDNMSWNVYGLPNVSDYQLLPSAKRGYVKIALTQDDYNVGTDRPVKKKSTLFINLHNANTNGGTIAIEQK